MKTIRQAVKNPAVIPVSFGITDAKGRDIGVTIAAYEADFIEAPASSCYYRIEAGHYFVFEPQPTRDGEKYGASQNWRLFPTEEARSTAIARYLLAAKKRAQKKA